jgi:uncharacterized coiled-coil protein SlyX
MTYEVDPKEQFSEWPPLNMEVSLKIIYTLARDLAETRQETQRLRRQVQLLSENIEYLRNKRR